MIIKDLDLDSLSREEYLSFIQCIVSYYTVLWQYSLSIQEVKKNIGKELI